MCGKKLLLLSLLSLAFSFSVVAEMTASEKSLMRELMQTNEKLENRLKERGQQLIDKDEQLNARDQKLTELSNSLEVIKAENETIKTENKTQKQENETTKGLLLNRESFENELRIYLAGEAMAKEIHRWVATGVAVLSLGMNGYQFFSNL